MSTQSDMSVPDTTLPAFDPGLDIATVVFSHVQCVKTRLILALVSKLWRDASKPAAAYPLEFDFDAFPYWPSWTRCPRIIGLLDNDEALSLPYERVVGLLGETANFVSCAGLLGETANFVSCYAAMRGSVRLLKWTLENNRAWRANTWYYAAEEGHLSALKYLHENGCPWDWGTCHCAARQEHWNCLQYMVDNKCPDWEYHAKLYAEHLR
jgi:hypothetical protein